MELFFGLIIAGIVAAWVYQDGTKRGMESGSALMWALGNLLLLLLFLPLYLLNRPSLPTDSRPAALASTSVKTAALDCVWLDEEVPGVHRGDPARGVTLQTLCS